MIMINHQIIKILTDVKKMLAMMKYKRTCKMFSSNASIYIDENVRLEMLK